MTQKRASSLQVALRSQNPSALLEPGHPQGTGRGGRCPRQSHGLRRSSCASALPVPLVRVETHGRSRGHRCCRQLSGDREASPWRGEGTELSPQGALTSCPPLEEEEHAEDVQTPGTTAVTQRCRDKGDPQKERGNVTSWGGSDTTHTLIRDVIKLYIS